MRISARFSPNLFYPDVWSRKSPISLAELLALGRAARGSSEVAAKVGGARGDVHLWPRRPRVLGLVRAGQGDRQSTVFLLC
jgi:hypothetical protein